MMLAGVIYKTYIEHQAHHRFRALRKGRLLLHTNSFFILKPTPYAIASFDGTFENPALSGSK